MDFRSPEAELFRGNNMDKVGQHGAGPFWAMNDGGRIVGEVVAKADSPNQTAIPWLLLKVKSNALASASSRQSKAYSASQPLKAKHQRLVAMP